jgi:hypothetical protein
LNLGQRSAYECSLGADGNDRHRSIIVLVAKFVQALSSRDTRRSYLELHHSSATNGTSVRKGEGHTTEAVMVNGSISR